MFRFSVVRSAQVCRVELSNLTGCLGFVGELIASLAEASRAAILQPMGAGLIFSRTAGAYVVSLCAARPNLMTRAVENLFCLLRSCSKVHYGGFQPASLHTLQDHLNPKP